MPAFMKMVKTVKIRTYRNSWSLNAGLGMLDSGRRTPDLRTLDTGLWTLTLGAKFLDPGHNYWTPDSDARPWMLDFGCWILEAGHEALDSGY